ncbi:F-box/LRR-repeat protein At4g14103-like isoform X1 [Silene latifolia]|uniref:F-box/LRR-repeat protein At4g14103-like isoform X1 n=2 Tax=Silene latifolia TaxID=37657 RepID=UPI003D76EE56
MRCAFNWRNTLDFDYTPLDLPLPIPRCETFKAFVSSVLKAFCSPYLSKFTLRIGRLANMKESIPDLEPVLLNEWLHFPLTRDGVREIDLSIHVKQFAQLPQALFTRETLQVLKLDGSLGIHQVCAMPSFNLPNLKTLHLCYAGVFTDDSFLTRLVSSCPSLQDLKVLNCLWEHGDIISISSTSLRRLFLHIERSSKLYEKCSEHVLIDSPNLEYFTFLDNLALRYSITTMNALLKAEIYIGDIGDYHPRTWEDCFESLLSLLRGSSNASHLYLRGSCNEILEYYELKDDQLGVFHNLKHLELVTDWMTKWDKVLLDFLKRSPFLEILSFPKGLFEEGPNR